MENTWLVWSRWVPWSTRVTSCSKCTCSLLVHTKHQSIIVRTHSLDRTQFLNQIVHAGEWKGELFNLIGLHRYNDLSVWNVFRLSCLDFIVLLVTCMIYAFCIKTYSFKLTRELSKDNLSKNVCLQSKISSDYNNLCSRNPNTAIGSAAKRKLDSVWNPYPPNWPPNKQTTNKCWSTKRSNARKRLTNWPICWRRASSVCSCWSHPFWSRQLLRQCTFCISSWLDRGSAWIEASEVATIICGYSWWCSLESTFSVSSYTSCP